MRILHLDSGPAWRGGQQQLHYLIGGLKRQGIQQFLAARKGSPLATRAAELEVPVRALSLSSEWNLLSLASVARLVGRFRPHLLHAHDSRTLGLAVMLKSLGWGGGVVAARRVAFSIRGNPWWKFKYGRQTSRVIAVSRYIRDLLIEEGLEPGQVEVVYDGVDAEAAPLPEQRSSARRRLGVADGEFLIGCVGHLTPEKGHALLIRGFSEILRTHPESRLAVVGEGPLRAELERLIRQTGLQGRAVLTGFVPDLEGILPGFDLLVHPSLAEGLGSVLLQAMSRQVPLCASRTGGIPEAVIDGETGFLFSPGSPDALVRSVLRARSHPGLARRQAERAAARVRSAFSVERMVAETRRVYSDILNL